MAYTPLTTQVAAGTASAAGWANVVKANFESMGPHLVVRKPADESVVSSIAPQDDDHLLMAVAANEVWQFECIMITTGLFDFLGQFTFPSGSIVGSAWGFNPSTVIAMHNLFSSSSPSGQFFFRADSTTNARTHFAAGVFTNGGTAGNFRLQWAQNVSGGTATIVKANSTLWGMRLSP